MNSGNKVNKLNNQRNRNSYTTQVMNYYSSNSTNFTTIIFFVIVLITLVFISYYLYTLYNKTPVIIEQDLISNVIDGKIEYNVSGSSIPVSQFSNEYTISMWLKVDDYSYRYGQEKVILTRGTGDNVNPEIVLGAKSNDLMVRIGLSSQQTYQIDNTTEKFKNMDKMLEQQETNKTNFGSVSNNDVVPLNKMVPWIESSDATYTDTSMMRGMEQTRYLLETFAVNNELVDTMSSIMISICNIFKSVEDYETSKIMLTLLDKSLDDMDMDMTANKTTRPNAINTQSDQSIDQIIAILENSSNMKNLKNEITNLFEMSVKIAEINPSEEDMLDSLASINQKLKTANCELTLEEADFKNNTRVQQVLKNMMRKMVYQLFYNLGVAVAEQHGDMIKMQGVVMSDKIGQCIIKDYPLQRWTNIILTVFNQNVNLYKDGLLVSSCIMTGFPQIQTGDLILFPNGGIAGSMTKLMYSNMALNQQQIQDIYNAGPKLSKSFFEQIPNWVIYIAISLVSMLVVLLLVQGM